MSNHDLPERNKTILNGRVYPAIRACVNNRYKIVLGIFAYYSFIFTSDKFFEIHKTSNINLFVSIIFSIFVIHNLVNYWWNKKDQVKIENKGESKRKWPWLEILFSIATLFLIWGAYGYFLHSY
jgi:hypothetical protein